MTLRTITSPYDQHTLAELQAHIGTYLGTAWASLSSAAQTAYQRIIDSSAEYLTKRFAHEPWMMHELSLSLASGTAILTLGAACRHVVRIIETYSGDTRVITPTTKAEFYEAWGTDGASAHPWSTQTTPRWFLDGMTGDNPPQQQWKRVPTPDAAITGTALVRPYLTLLSGSGDASYTHIPANAATALTDYILHRVELYRKNWEPATAHKGALEDEIATLNIADNPDGAYEATRSVEVPGWFSREMNP